MVSPQKSVPWPPTLLAGDIEVQIAKRVLSVDPQDEDEGDAESEHLRVPALVGEVSNKVLTWTKGPLMTKAPRDPVAVDDAGALARTLPIFLRRGNSYRCYTCPEQAQAVPVPEAKPEATPLPNGDAAEAEPAEGAEPSDGESPDSSKGRGAKRRKQYSQAVAFEFVSGVLSNVLGPGVEEDEMWDK
jgi:hypothetical protein